MIRPNEISPSKPKLFCLVIIEHYHCCTSPLFSSSFSVIAVTRVHFSIGNMSLGNAKLINHNNHRGRRDFSRTVAHSPLQKQQSMIEKLGYPWGNYSLNNTPLGIEGLEYSQNCASDMYEPVIRPYPPPYGRETMKTFKLDDLRSAPLLEYVDIVTTLKGMSFPEAEELFRIQQAFNASLEALITKNEIALRVQQHLQKDQHFDTPALTRRIQISRSRLFHRIIQRLRPLKDEQASRRLISLYLASCECLMQTDDKEDHDTALEVCICYYGPTMSVGHAGPALEVLRLPDLLDFDPISEIQHEGEKLMIIPHYRRNYFPAADAIHTTVSYTLGSSHSWLSWDASIQGFEGVLPVYSEADDRWGKVYSASPVGPYPAVNLLRIEVKALLTIECRHPVIRLERTLRARITLKIIPWYVFDSSCTLDDYDNGLVGLQCDSPLLSLARFNPCNGSYSSDRTDVDAVQTSYTESLCYKWASDFLDDTDTHKSLREDISCFESHEHLTLETLSPATYNQDSHRRIASSSPPTLSPAKRHRETNITTLPEASSDSAQWLNGSLSSLNLDKERSPESSPVLSANQTSPSCNLLRRDSTEHETPRKIDSYGLSQSHTERLPSSALLNSVSHNCNIVTREKLVSAAGLNCSTHSDASEERTESASSQVDQLSSDCESGSWTRRSQSTEIILEDSLVDPVIRREQALLWKALLPSAATSSAHKPTLNVQERKDIYDAMKKSAEEAQIRRNKRLGSVEVLDDVFLEGGSDRGSGIEDAMIHSSAEQSLHSSEGKSEIGSDDQQLAELFN